MIVLPAIIVRFLPSILPSHIVATAPKKHLRCFSHVLNGRVETQPVGLPECVPSNSNPLDIRCFALTPSRRRVLCVNLREVLEESWKGQEATENALQICLMFCRNHPRFDKMAYLVISKQRKIRAGNHRNGDIELEAAQSVESLHRVTKISNVPTRSTARTENTGGIIEKPRERTPLK